MPIKASLQPSVKEILLHLVTQTGKSSHGKSSILLALSANWTRMVDRIWQRGHVGKDREQKLAQRRQLGHDLCLPCGPGVSQSWPHKACCCQVAA